MDVVFNNLTCMSLVLYWSRNTCPASASRLISRRTYYGKPASLAGLVLGGWCKKRGVRSPDRTGRFTHPLSFSSGRRLTRRVIAWGATAGKLARFFPPEARVSPAGFYIENFSCIRPLPGVLCGFKYIVPEKNKEIKKKMPNKEKKWLSNPFILLVV